MLIALNMPEHILITQCETRWNSIFYKLERIVDFKAPLNAVLSNISSVSGLSSYEWSIVESYVEALRPLEQGTKIMSGTRYSTIPMVISVLNSIFDHIKAVDMNDFGNALMLKAPFHSFLLNFSKYRIPNRNRGILPRYTEYRTDPSLTNTAQH